jgi:putative transcriptional regulator
MRRWLIERRKEREMTQMNLADQAGISRAYYSQIEQNYRSPSIRVAKKLADILGLEWTVFYDEEMPLMD